MPARTQTPPTAVARPRTYLYEFELALWPLPASALIVTAIAWGVDVRARRRALLDLCPKCNYDRTGIAAGAVCPECGAKPSERAAVASPGREPRV